MPAPDDPHPPSPAEFPDDLATLRVSPPSPATMPDDMQTIAVAKPVAAPPAEVAVMGANPDSPVPFVFGKRIAKGGMGAILEGEDCKLGRTIAVKVMLDANANDDQARRFVQEAAVLGKLAHPNIVPVYDLGRDSEGALYYTMKLVKGRTLQDILDDLRREKKEALEHYTLDRLLTVFRKVCDALAFAHASNIIHRDLKPENIMVGEFGEVLVMDWGIAKVLNELGIEEPMAAVTPQSMSGTGSFTATMEGAVMGTPNYMSPEQAMGKVNELDERSDIFSLGGILYAILTLRPPVEGKDVWEVLEKVQAANITEPTKFGATTGKGTAKAKSDVLEAKKITPLPHIPGGRVPNALSAVAMKALKLDKTKRYQNVAEFSSDIEKYQGGYATTAEKAGFAKQLALLIKRNKGIFTTAAAAWALITGLAVWFVINLHEKEQRAISGELAARQSLAKSALNLAEAAQREGDGPAMQAALGDVPDDLRDSTWNYLFAQSDTSIARVRIGATELRSVAAHPRLPGVFAVSDTDHKVTVIEARTGRRLLEFTPTFRGKPGDPRLAVSPDAERIAVGNGGDNGGIAIHSARDGKKVSEWDAPKCERLEFSSDAKLLLQTQLLAQGRADSRQLHVWDATEGKVVWSYPSEPQINVHGVFTPDGQQVVTSDAKEGLRLVNAADGTLIRTLPRTRGKVQSLAADSGGSVVGASEGGWVIRFDPRDGRVLTEFRAIEGNGGRVAVTPDGRQIVTAFPLPDGRQDIRLWDAKSGQQVQSLLGGSGRIYSISVHPLTGELLVAGANSRVWDLTGVPAKWTLNGVASSSPFFGSDDLLFAPGNGGPATLWKLQAGKPVVVWKPENSSLGRLSITADGRLAACGSLTDERPTLLLRNPGPSLEQAAQIKMKYGSLSVLRLSPAGDRLAAVERFRDTLELLDTTTGQQPAPLDRKNIIYFQDLGWLGGQRLVGLATAKANRGDPGSEEWVVIWDTTTGKILQTATNRTPMNVLAVAPDGRRFAEAGADKKVRIRDAGTLAVLQEFRAHDEPITALAWHPTKPILATASAHSSVRLWNLDTGKRLEELRGPVNPPSGLAFSPSGQRLSCASNEGTRVWEPPSLNDKPAAEKTAGGDWEDLLATLTPSLVAQTGNGWRMEGGALFSPGQKYATLPLPGHFAGTSYTVRVKLRQLTPKHVFHIVLPVGDRMTGFELEGRPDGGIYSGLVLVNGKFGKNLPGAVEGKQVKDSEQHDLEVTVRLDGANAKVTTMLDGQPLYDWAGPSAALSQEPRWATTPPGSIALGTFAADWVVYEVKLKRLEK